MSRKTTNEYGVIIYYNDANMVHREDGPAKMWPDGYKEWWINNKCHREDGPATEDDIDKQLYFINDIELTEQDFFKWKLQKFLDEI